MELTPSPTTTPNSDKRFTRRDSDAPEVANLTLPLTRPSSIYATTTANGDKKSSSRVSLHPVPGTTIGNEYIPRSDPHYAFRRSAFRRSKTFWLMMLLALAMCLAVGIGIGYAVGVNGARVVTRTPETVGQPTTAEP